MASGVNRSRGTGNKKPDRYRAECQTCKALATEDALTPNDAREKARSEGWQAIGVGRSWIVRCGTHWVIGLA